MTPRREDIAENLLCLSFAQRRLWFLNELDPGNAAYNLPRVIQVVGTLDTGALTAAIQALVARHDGLRTVFTAIDGEPRQTILSAMALELSLIELQELPEAERARETLRVVGEQARAPFDLASGPLLRVALIRLRREEHILVLVMHHIITDGWSMSIFFQELADLYESFVDGRPPALPELSIRYADFIHWQINHLSNELLAPQIEYWKKKLEGAEPILELPTDHPRPAAHRGRGSTEHFFLSQEIAEGLKRLGQSEGATLFMTLLAAFQALLWRYTSQDTILVGSPVAGRNELALENLIGFFVNTLILRADFSRDPSVRELLKQLRATCLEAYAHQDVPFERLVEELKPERTLNQSPLFQVMLILQNTPRQKIALKGLLLEEIDFDSGITKFDLTLEVIEHEGLHCSFEYNTDLFDRATIKHLIGHFETLIGAFIQHPDRRVSSLPVLTEQERAHILVDWNNTAAAFPEDLCIHTAFEEQAARTPQAVAFLYEGKQCSYRQLNESANRLARHLIHQGVRPGAPVGIAIERSLDMMVGLLGILKAGAVYVPLDTNGPEQRLALMIKDSKVDTIVTLNAFKHGLPATAKRIVCLDTEKAAIDTHSATNPGVPRSPADLAYIIYTSGSTGIPKGVEGTHRASINRFAWMWDRYPFAPNETCCQKTALSFIDSVWEIFGPLLRGIRNVIIPDQTLLDPGEFIQTLAQYQVSRIVLIPSVLRMLLDYSSTLAEDVPNLTLWSASGETLCPEVAQRFLTTLPKVTLLNIYGSSEVAADVTWHEVRADETTSPVPIGKPIPNTQVYILDRYLNPVPMGVRGEIHVGGVCLARGYWNNPEVTAERFIRNPFAPDSRLYKTGDLGRFLPDGTIEYLGRTDNQVKLRGFRVELGEIEAALRSHPSVREAVAMVHGEQQKLAAYLVAKGKRAPSAAELGRFVRSKLPEHMVPSTYAVLESMPTLPSGKINRRALLAVDGCPASDHVHVAARTDVEKALAAIWQEVLHVNPVGIQDNFFELGGHSLLAVQVISRIRRTFDLDVSVRSIFEHPLIAGLAQEVEKAKAAGLKARMPPLIRRPPLAPKDALISQLDQLSPEEIRALLDNVIARRPSAAGA